MDSTQERQLNQTAYRQLSSFIQKTYPPGRFVAISGGKIVADAAHFQELNSILHQMGNHAPDVLVVQAGVDYPERVTIFAHNWCWNTEGMRISSGSVLFRAGRE